MWHQTAVFVIRWLSNALVLLGLALWLPSGLQSSGGWSTLLLAALFLTICNALIKPLVILLSLPLVYLTWGFFTLFFNGLMLVLTARFYSGLTIDSWAVLALAILGISLANCLVTLAFKPRQFYEN